MASLPDGAPAGAPVHLEWGRPGLASCGQIDVVTVAGPPDAVTCERCHAMAAAEANRARVSGLRALAREVGAPAARASAWIAAGYEVAAARREWESRS